MEVFIWNLLSSGATDVIKGIIGKNFKKLISYKSNNNQDGFNTMLNIILDSNDEIKRRLEALQSEDNITQNHNGTGDNIVGGKTVNNTYNISNIDTINNNSELSNEAGEILLEVEESKKNSISKMYTIDRGHLIFINNKQLIEENNPRSSAKYIDALEELVTQDFIKTTNEKKYTVTKKGYEYIDNIINKL